MSNNKNLLLVVAGKMVDRNDETLDKEELVWANLKFIDQIVAPKTVAGVVKKPNPVILMGMAAKAYFALHPDKTPADLEREFRQRNFESGLIAVPWRDDPSVAPLVEAGKVVVKHLTGSRHENKNNDSFGGTSLDYYVKYSIRPRALAEEEMIQHCPGGADENLIRLEQAGDLGVKDTNVVPTKEGQEKLDAGEEKISDEDAEARETWAETTVRLDDDEIEFSTKVQDGAIRLCYQAIDMEKEWHKIQAAHPDAKVTPIAMGPTGALILALVEDGTIICPFARTVNNRFLPLSIQK